MSVRTSQITGSFVPEDKKQLKQAVTDLLNRSARASELVPSVPCAILAPHAGFDYSGPLAAAAWQMTLQARPARIAILSPAHKTPVKGVAVPAQHGAIAMPGLRVRIDRDACTALVKARQARRDDAAFENEHGIDLHIPFARSLHAGVPVVPLVVGDATPEMVAAAVNTLAALEGTTLFVLSSDLSHYLTETDAQKRDVRTAGLIEIGAGDHLTPADACGSRVIAGFLASDLGQTLRSIRLGRYTSCKVTGDSSRVVGYGAWAFFTPTEPMFGPVLQTELLDVARKSLMSRLTRGTLPQVRVDSYPAPLRSVMASFVSLRQNDRLRGCIGSLFPFRPLVSDVVNNAARAGFEDQRFGPLTARDLTQVQIGVSVLSRPMELGASDRDDLIAQIAQGQHGLIVQEGDRRGVLLPSVWDNLPEPQDFVGTLLRKAGLAPDHWSDSLRFHSFHAETFTEDSKSAAQAAA